MNAKNGIAKRPTASAGPTNNITAAPNAPCGISAKPLPNPAKFSSNCFSGVNPINNRNGIAGSAIMNAGPANATTPTPANTLASPISLKPSASDFNPPPLPCAA